MRVRKRKRTPPKPYHRCPGCGYKVKLPCLSCQIRAMPKEGEEFLQTVLHGGNGDAGFEPQGKGNGAYRG